MRDATGEALGGASFGAEAVQGVGADLASIAVHQHRDGAAGLDQAGRIRPDLLRVGAKVSRLEGGFRLSKDGGECVPRSRQPVVRCWSLL